MSKSKSKGGDFDFDDKDLDFGNDFDFDFDKISADKAPKVKGGRAAIQDVGRGMIEGMKDEALSANFFKRVVKKALPKEYGKAMDFAEDSVGTIKDTFADAAKIAKPAINQTKRTIQKLVPSMRGKIPKGMADKLEAWSKPESTGVGAQGDQRESGLQMMMASLFQQQAEDQQEKDAQTGAKSMLQDALTTTRHNDNMSQLDAIRMNTLRLATYQDRVTARYQRQMLEIQYRHYFVAQDTLEELKKVSVTATTNLEAITHNTALPEIQKMKKSESFKEQIRNRFVGGALDSVLGKRGEFASNFKKNLAGTVQSKMRDFTDSFTTALEAAESMNDMMESSKEMGMDMSYNQIGGSIVGGSMVQKLGNWLGDKASKAIGKNKKLDTAVRKGAQNLGYGMENKEQLLKDFANSDKWDNIPIIGGFVRGIKDLVPSLRNSMSVTSDNMRGLREPVAFNNGANKSITEIIPGFLSRIHQELKIIRTGDASTEALVYDHSANKFSEHTTFKAKVFGDLIRKDDRERTDRDSDALIDMIDPKKKLKRHERAALSKHLITNNINGVTADPTQLARTSHYTGDAAKHAKKFSRLFKDAFKIDDEGKMAGTVESATLRRQFASKYNELGSAFSGINGRMQDYVNAGNYQQLQELGIIDDQGYVNNKLMEEYMGGKMPNLGQKPNGPVKPTTTQQSLMNQIHTDHTTQTNAKNINRRRRGKRGMFGDPDGEDISTPKGWNKDVINNQERMIEAIKEANTSETTDKILEAVVSIGSILPELSFTGGNGDPKQAEKLGFFQRSIGGLLSSGIKGAFSGARKLVTGSLKLGMKLTRGVFKGTGWGAGKVLGGLGWAKNYLTSKYEAADIWVKGDLKPRLLAWKLEAGEYLDAKTGEVITKLEDIKGDIKDKAGNIVMTLEDFKKAYVPKAKMRITRAIQSIASLAKGALDMGLNGTRSLYSAMWKYGKMGHAFLQDKLSRGEDVYVKGEKLPRLTAIVMRGKGYFSVNTGKVIRRGHDIDGAVRNAQNEIVLTEADIAQGIHDVDGKPFKSRLMKAKDFVVGKVKKAWDITTGLVGRGWEMTKGLFGGIKKGIFGADGLEIAGGKKIRTTLEAILDLLRERLPKPKRIRKGSWEEREKEDAARSEEKKSALEKIKEGVSGNPLAKLLKAGGAGILGALGGLFGKKGGKGKDGEEEGKGGSSWLDRSLDALNAYSDYKMIKGMGGAGKAAEAGAAIAGKTRLGRWLGAGRGLIGKGAALGGQVLEGFSPSAMKGLRAVGGKGAGLLAAGKGKIGTGLEAVKGWGGKAAEAVKGKMPGKGLWEGAKDMTKSGWGKMAGWFGKGGAAAAGAGAAEAGEAAAVGSKALRFGKTLKAVTPGAIAGLGLDYAGDKVGHENRTGAGLDIAGDIATGASTGAVVASFIPVPILSTMIGGLVGGAAGGAYGLYKNWDTMKFKASDFFGEKASLSNFFFGQRLPGKIGMVRMAQYGVLPTEEDKVKKLLTLEKIVRDNAKMVNGRLSYSTKDIPAKDILKAFSIDPTKPADVQRFHEWFAVRFKPVFAQHMESLYAVNPKANLDTLDDDLDPDQKTKYLNAVKSIPGIFGWTKSPFADGENLSSNAAEVDNAIAIATKSIGDTGKNGKPAVVAAVAAGAAVNAAQGGGKTDGQNLVNGVNNLTDVPGNSLKDVAKSAGKVGISGAGVGFENGKVSLTSLDSVRMKTYGLVNLDLAKVRAIMKLEEAAEDGLTFTSDKTANWSGDVPALVAKCGGAFGVPSLNTEEGTNFMTWLTHRFIPVFTTLASGIKVITGKNTPVKTMRALTDEQALNVATALQTAKDSNGVSVWTITTSPWPDYTLNTSSQSVQRTLIMMRSTVKPTTASEKTTMVDRRTDENIRQAQKNGSLVKGPWTVAQGAADAAAMANNTPSRGFMGAIEHTAGQLWHDVKNVFGFGDRSQVGEGAATANVGMTGTGGKVDGIASPKGAAGYAAMKPMLDEVAKMVGVDPNLLATFAAIESGFNPSAHAKGGSASGLFQFIDSTWNMMIKKYGPKYGIAPGTNQFDPRANALMGAEYLKNNAQIISKAVGRAPTQTDLYLAHFMGTGGATKLLKADPDTIAANLFPKEASANPNIFYPGKQPITIKGMYNNITQLMANRTKQFGIGGKMAAPATMPVAAGAKPKDAVTAAKGVASTAPGVPAPTKPVTPAVAPVAAKTSVTAAVTGNGGSSGEVAKITVIGKRKSVDSTSSVASAMSSNAVAMQTAARTSSYTNSGLDNGSNSDVVKVLQAQTDILKDIRDALSKNGIRVASVDSMPNSSQGSVASSDTSTPTTSADISGDNPQASTNRSRRAIPVSMKKTA